MTGQEQKIKISDLPSSVSFRGLWTLGYQNVDGKKTSVKVSLDEIRTAYENAVSAATAAREAAGTALSAAGNANHATGEANNAASLALEKATLAVSAAEKANAAAGRVDTSIVNAEKATEAANQATTDTRQAIADAETATANANKAANEANTSRDAANAAAGKADTATAHANEATAAAEQAATEANAARDTADAAAGKADTATAHANEATAAAKQVTTEANTARDAANSAAGKANTATVNANEATAAAQQATTEANTARDTAHSAAGKADTATANANEATRLAGESTALMDELNAHPMKPQGGLWYKWNPETGKYENTGIQAKGDVGSSFRIIGRYDTLDELEAAVPDGADVDGVYAIGADEPFDYYAWLFVDGMWKWDNQGKLRGAEGKSSYEVWTEYPENEGKTKEQYFDWLSPTIDTETGRWNIQGTDTGVQAEAVDAHVTVKENTDDSYVLHVKSAKGEFDTPNLRGFDVKVREVETNTPDDYRLEITTVKGTIKTPNLKGRSGSAVIDLDHEPVESDTHYTYNGVQYAFSVGDEVRWYDTDSEAFVLFKLYAMTETGAVWEEMGSGAGSLPTDVILTGPSELSSDESESYIYLQDGYLKGKEE